MNLGSYTQLKQVPLLVNNLGSIMDAQALVMGIRMAEAQIFLLSHGLGMASIPDKITIGAGIADIQSAIIQAEKRIRLQEILDKKVKRQAEQRIFAFENLS